MNRRLIDALVQLLLVAPLVYLWYSAAALPEQVVSDFNFQGVADGFMPRGSYLLGAALFTVGLPMLLGLALPVLSGRMSGAINMPKREYWMEPERRTTTLAYLRTQYRVFAVALGAHS